MINIFVEAWDKNKNKLEDYFKNTLQIEYNNYKEISTKLIELVINPYLKEKEDLCYPICNGLNLKKITEIDGGDYQGTLIFLIPFKCYEPTEEEYIVTTVCYGSCGGCDTLLGILDSVNGITSIEAWFSDLAEKLPNKEQLSDYMRLALDLLQQMKFFDEREEIYE